MPFEIVRNDITCMKADAVVNTANPKPVVGSGLDAGIHKKAGPKLLEARKKIGDIETGSAAVTPAFELDAKYVIHVAGPVWMGGGHNEEKLLHQCYRKALELAVEKHCESVAFPLISTGNYAFPKPLALQIATQEFSAFLLEHEINISLVVFGSEAFELSEKLYYSVKSYIDENYVSKKLSDEYEAGDPGMRGARSCRIQDMMTDCCSVKKSSDISSFLDTADKGFSDTLLHLIDLTGKKDSEIYKKANVKRQLFSKIRKDPGYRPKKTTALAFAFALELDLEGTKDLIGRAGYALSHSSKFDLIVEYFIKNRNYDIFELNEVLFEFDQPLLGV